MDARDFAILTLDEKQLPGMPKQAFKRRSPTPPEDPRDRALGETLVAGVVKNYALLLTLIGLYSKRQVRDVDPRARLILLVGLYQLRFLDRVPEHAVVTEAVRQTRRMGEPTLPRASGFVNAVLREALRKPDIDEKLPPRENALAYCEVVLSHPRPLVQKLLNLLGPADAIRFCEHNNRTPPTLLRLIGDAAPDSLKPAEPGIEVAEKDRDAVLPDRESAPQIPSPTLKITPHEQLGMVVVEGAKAADFARWSAAGVAQVQDATSAGVVPLLDVQPGMTALDRCCGVGTKTQQLSELIGDTGRVYAVDAAGARISLLRRLMKQRPGLMNVQVKRAEWVVDLPDDWPTHFDRILIDAPCSNSGVLARRPEARYAQSPDNLAELPPLQTKLLIDTWPRLTPGGLLAYATCSVWPEENSDIVRAFLTQTSDAELTDERAWWPSFSTDDPTRYRDGGYVALLRKR